MPDFDWKKTVQAIAPTIATALGGPLAGVAVSQLGAAIFGRPEATIDEVSAAIASGTLTPEQVAAMHAADLEFQTRMAELQIDLAKLEQASDAAVLADVQDARARQVATKDYMPQIIFGLLFCAWIGAFMLFYFYPMPQDEFLKALITKSYALIELSLPASIAYFIGSSRGSKRANDTVRDIAAKSSAN